LISKRFRTAPTTVGAVFLLLLVFFRKATLTLAPTFDDRQEPGRPLRRVVE
jgi:hypothetical protein